VVYFAGAVARLRGVRFAGGRSQGGSLCSVQGFPEEARMSSDAEAPVQGRSPGSSKPGGSSKGGAAPSGVLKTLGKYQIEKKIGAGGMGTVYLARDIELRRVVALKVLARDKAQNPTLVRRFKAEAQAAAQLRHDSIVSVYDSGEADGYLYIAMEYVEGQDLHELVNKRGPLPIKRSIEIVKQVASALQHASEQNIVHRDIKPSNILVRRDGRVKLTDLGLARSVDDTIETGITRAGTTVGTVDYMAPEQARSSQAADIRSDIYSLGCTWYHMLTGGPPFPEGSMTNKLQAHAITPAPDPRALNDQVTEGLVAVIHRMLAKKPADRYQTPAELLKDLEGGTLTKAGFSKEIMHAIEEESATDVPTHDGTSTSTTKSAKAAGPAYLPPPSRKQPLGGADEKPNAVNVEAVKLALMVGGIAAAVGGVVWLVWSFGGLLDVPNQVVKNVNDPFGGQAPAANQVTVAPVGGAGAGSATLIQGTTAVAPIFGSGDGVPIQPGMGTAGANPATLGTGQAGPGANANAGPGAPSLSGTQSTSPGTGGAPTTSTGQPGRPLAVIPFDPVKPPEWISAVSKQSPKGLRAITVGPGATSAAHFHTLGEALAQVSGEGAIVQLVGNGPFVVNSAVSVSAKRLQIAAVAGAEPVIVLAAGGLTFTGGTIELKGLHLVADGAANRGATLLAVRDASAVLQQCSVTVGGNTNSGVTVLSVDGAVPSGIKLLLDRTVIRGNVKTAIDLRTSFFEAVLQDSLLVAGDGCAVRLTAGSQPTPLGLNDRPPRAIKCLFSTLASRERVFDLSADAALSEPPPLHLSLVNSTCCTAAATGSRVLLAAEGWKQETLRTACTWVAPGSAFLGFADLLELGSGSGVRVKDGENWRVFWRKKVDPEQFQTDAWPLGVPPNAVATIADFAAANLPSGVKSLGDSGEPPGVDVAKLESPTTVAPERIAAMAYRRPLPPVATAPTPDKFVARIDLKKDDLGAVLSRGDWPDGSAIEAVGSGVCQMTPAQIGKHQWRVVFRQSPEGGPLRIAPKETIKEAEALFRVEQGTLVLEGLRWQQPEGRPNVPQWLVSAVDGHVVLRSCELQGPERPVAAYQGLVRFATAATAAASPPTLSLIDSFLHSSGTLVRAEAGPAALFVRNSVLVARGTAFDLRPRAVDNNLPLTVDIVQSTVSANQTVFQWTAASLTQPASTPARVFVEGTVFGPPFPLRAGEASQASLLTYSGPMLEQRQVEWWGLGNGVSTDIKFWLRPEGQAPLPEKSGLQVWNDTWGAGHDVRTLHSADGVRLADPLPTRRDGLRPKSYQLHPSCKASVWAENRPIGADVAALDAIGPDKAPPANAKAGPNATKKPAAPTTKPGSPSGGF
jgi:serine/threonine protein kinase